MVTPCLAVLAVPVWGQVSVRPPARVQVAAKEFSFVLSRPSVRSGRVIIQLANFGEDVHDLALQRIAPGTRIFQTPEVSPGRQADLNLRLGPARYRLWCSIADHRERGMQATLTVKR
jgi:hypothetical protein